MSGRSSVSFRLFGSVSFVVLTEGNGSIYTEPQFQELEFIGFVFPRPDSRKENSFTFPEDLSISYRRLTMLRNGSCQS